jgi:hypothetical protein
LLLEDTEQPLEGDGFNGEIHSREHTTDPPELIPTYSGQSLETAGWGAHSARDD